MSVQEYLRLDQDTSDVQYEYLNGVARLMAKGSVEHDSIVRNIYSALSQRLASGPCAVFRAQTFVMDQAANQENYFHPDVTISCDAADRQPGTWLINSPRVVVEVLSPATEHLDRGRKLAAYKSCQSIQEIVLIDLPVHEVEVHRRVENRTSWRYIVYGSNEEVKLSSINVNIPMSEIFTSDTMAGWEEYAISIEEYHRLHERYSVSFEYINGNLSLRDGTPVVLLGGVTTEVAHPALAVISDVTKDEARQIAAFIASLRRDTKSC
jgi:Uma2 family endonuclease